MKKVVLIRQKARKLFPVILAADPGVNGGLVWNDRYGGMHALAMPDTLPTIANVFRHVNPQFFLVEHIHSRPGQSAQNMGKLIRHCGHLEGIATALHIQWRETYPHVWMKQMIEDAKSKDFASKTLWKTHLLNMAVRLQPKLFRGLRTKAEKLRISDAVLLWHFAKRVHREYNL